jgi:hypothetical protein
MAKLYLIFLLFNVFSIKNTDMKKIVQITESDIYRIVKRVLKEQAVDDGKLNLIMDMLRNYNPKREEGFIKIKGMNYEIGINDNILYYDYRGDEDVNIEIDDYFRSKFKGGRAQQYNHAGMEGAYVGKVILDALRKYFK